jgi:hypothetical protein
MLQTRGCRAVLCLGLLQAARCSSSSVRCAHQQPMLRILHQQPQAVARKQYQVPTCSECVCGRCTVTVCSGLGVAEASCLCSAFSLPASPARVHIILYVSKGNNLNIIIKSRCCYTHLKPQHAELLG